MVFPLEGYELKEHANYSTLAWAKNSPILLRTDRRRLPYCWYDMGETGTCKPENKILHSVFVSNGVINFIETILGLNEEIIKKMVSKKKVVEKVENWTLYGKQR